MQFSDYPTLQYSDHTTPLPPTNDTITVRPDWIYRRELQRWEKEYKWVWENTATTATIEIKSPNLKDQLTPTKVIFNGECCIAFFPDGKKIIVKKNENDEFDKYTAVAYCIIKYIFESNNHYKKTIDKIAKSYKSNNTIPF